MLENNTRLMLWLLIEPSVFTANIQQISFILKFDSSRSVSLNTRGYIDRWIKTIDNLKGGSKDFMECISIVRCVVYIFSRFD